MTLDRTSPLARRLSTLTLAVGVSAALIGGVGLTAGCSVIGSNPDRYSCTNPGRADVQTLLGVFSRDYHGLTGVVAVDSCREGRQNTVRLKAPSKDDLVGQLTQAGCTANGTVYTCTTRGVHYRVATADDGQAEAMPVAAGS